MAQTIQIIGRRNLYIYFEARDGSGNEACAQNACARVTPSVWRTENTSCSNGWNQLGVILAWMVRLCVLNSLRENLIYSIFLCWLNISASYTFWVFWFSFHLIRHLKQQPRALNPSELYLTMDLVLELEALYALFKFMPCAMYNQDRLYMYNVWFYAQWLILK